MNWFETILKDSPAYKKIKYYAKTFKAPEDNNWAKRWTVNDEVLLRVLTYSFSPVYDEANHSFISRRKETFTNVSNWTKGTPHVAVRLPMKDVKKLIKEVPDEVNNAAVNAHYMLPFFGIDKVLSVKHDTATGKYYLPVKVLDRTKPKSMKELAKIFNFTGAGRNCIYVDADAFVEGEFAVETLIEYLDYKGLLAIYDQLPLITGAKGKATSSPSKLQKKRGGKIEE